MTIKKKVIREIIEKLLEEELSEKKLKKIAGVLGISTEDKDVTKLSEEVARATLNQFGQQDGGDDHS